MFQIYVLLAVLANVYANSVSTLECGACSLIITQLEAKIAEVDPKKKIEVGSFRVHPDGNQKLKEISYARSESFLSEMIENVCDDAKQYKLVQNTLTGKSVYVHRDATYLKGDESPEKLAKLQSACNDFIDSYEDDVVTFLKTEKRENPVRDFCHTEMSVCSSVDVSALPPNEPPTEDAPMTLADIPEEEL